MTRATGFNEVGELRPSQFFFSYGIGAIIDLPNYSVLVKGFNEDRYRKNETIQEERLLQFCRSYFQDYKHQIRDLKEIPVFRESTELEGCQGIDVTIFPKWLQCTTCKELHHLDALGVEFVGSQFQKDKQKFVHKTCNSKEKSPLMVPVRFCSICENGHLSEFPWLEYVHDTSHGICSTPKLILRDSGRAGNLNDIHIHCANCGVSKGILSAFGDEGRKSIGVCSGEHPQVDVKEICTDNTDEKKPRLKKAVMVGASNTWFSVVYSSLYLSLDDKLEELVLKYWEDLSKVTSLDNLRVVQAFTIDKMLGFSDIPLEDIWKAIEKRQNQIANPEKPEKESLAAIDLKKPEWDHFAKINPKKETSEMIATLTSVPKSYDQYFSKLILFHKIRETKAYLGFTRLESPREFGEGESLIRSRLGKISNQSIPGYIPSLVHYGEGIMLQFRMETILNWLKKSSLEPHLNLFLKAEAEWKRMLGLDADKNIRSWKEQATFLLVHSFSHIWMRQIAMESGYAQASIRERLYVHYSENPSEFMAGVLLYTSSSDSDGTLGGLVRLGRPDTLARILDQALEEAKLCSTDPLCSSHSPTGEGTIATLSGAACYACMLAPETSCEYSNKWLDRSVIVPTLEEGSRAYFEI